jgi:hypothetical protein
MMRRGREDSFKNNEVDNIPKKPKHMKWTFDVNYNDHFETPEIAFRDIVPFLDTVASLVGKSRETLIIYDPYFCTGKMVPLLQSLGFSNVINLNRDFYADIDTDAVPKYDVLVTNPPYSANHKQKLLDYLKVSAKYSGKKHKDEEEKGKYKVRDEESSTPIAFALLLPTYTADKAYWREFAASCCGDTTATMSISTQTPVLSSLFEALYLMPPESYEFSHPEGTGKSVAPFYSNWFVGMQMSECIGMHKRKDESEERYESDNIEKRNESYLSVDDTNKMADQLKTKVVNAILVAARKNVKNKDKEKNNKNKSPILNASDSVGSRRKPTLVLNSLRGLEKHSYLVPKKEAQERAKERAIRRKKRKGKDVKLR